MSEDEVKTWIFLILVKEERKKKEKSHPNQGFGLSLYLKGVFVGFCLHPSVRPDRKEWGSRSLPDPSLGTTQGLYQEPGGGNQIDLVSFCHRNPVRT